MVQFIQMIQNYIWLWPILAVVFFTIFNNFPDNFGSSDVGHVVFVLTGVMFAVNVLFFIVGCIMYFSQPYICC